MSDWRNFETWQADGARTATERANTIWKQLLAEAVPPALDPAVAEALDAFVDRRKREIASARLAPAPTRGDARTTLRATADGWTSSVPWIA